MRIRATYLAAALFVAFAADSNATIIGSTYDFTTSVTGNTQISPVGGPTSRTSTDRLWPATHRGGTGPSGTRLGPRQWEALQPAAAVRASRRSVKSLIETIRASRTVTSVKMRWCTGMRLSFPRIEFCDTQRT